MRVHITNPLRGTTFAGVPIATTVLEKMPTVMTTSFTRQQIDLGIHDIMYQLSGQLADIVKPMVQTKELEVRRMNSTSLITST